MKENIYSVNTPGSTYQSIDKIDSTYATIMHHQGKGNFEWNASYSSSVNSSSGDFFPASTSWSVFSSALGFLPFVNLVHQPTTLKTCSYFIYFSLFLNINIFSRKADIFCAAGSSKEKKDSRKNNAQWTWKLDNVLMNFRKSFLFSVTSCFSLLQDNTKLCFEFEPKLLNI